MDILLKPPMKITNMRCNKKVLSTKINNHKNGTNQPFGWIYLATNTTNGKVYVGKVEFPRTINDRWKEHLKEGRKLKRLRQRNPNKKVWDTHLNNAIAKYKETVWNLKKIDDAYSNEELNEKETFWIKKYDSLNPKKGYNMTEGGDGGKLREEVKEKIRNSVIKKYKEDPTYRKKVGKASQERMKNPKYKAKILRHLNAGLEKKRKDPEFREKMSRFLRERHLKNGRNPEYIRKQKEAHEFQRKRIVEVKQFLIDIKEGKESRQLEKDYKISRPTINKNIREILIKYGIKNYKEAKYFLRDKNINKLLGGIRKNE